MSQKHWSTEEDVLKDLEEVYGMRVTNFHADIFVQGIGPPPPMLTDEDDLQQSCDERLHDYNTPPDLKGITQMLKIVKEHERDENDDFKINNQPNEKECIITISKLNPNVAPFMPNTKSTLTSTNDNKKNTDLINKKKCNNLKDSVKQVENDKDGGNDSLSMNINGTITNGLKNKEREILAEQLKNKICCKAKVDTFQTKKERNLAITSLLKLYSKPASTQSENNDTPKLITPDYFAKSKADTTKPTNFDEVLVANNKDSVNENHTIELKQNTPEDTTPSENFHVSNVEIQESIKKVNNWLKPTTPTPKKPSIYLGAFTFKRKESSTCKSPINSSDKTFSKSSTSTIAEYKPSKYAEELVKKFSDRQKLIETRVNMDPFTKIEAELKARDKIISQRALEKCFENQ